MLPTDISPPALRGRPIARVFAWALTLAVCAGLPACGGTVLDVQTFTVSLTDTLHTAVADDGTIVSTVLMEVDNDNGHAIGFGLKYAVTAGTLSSATGVSGVNGAASVTWTVTPAEAAASGQTELIFSACSNTDDPPSCTPQPLASLHVGG